MEKIILENRFTIHQKLTILLFIGAPFLIAIIGLLKMGFNSNLNYKGYLVLLLFLLLYSFLIFIAFSKRGFMNVHSNLYRGLFFREKLFSKKKINISDKPKVAVLKFKKSQKLAWVSVANPDLASEYNSFEINILNNRHTKREAIMELKKEQNVNRTLDFLTANFDLTKETYSPNFG